MQLAGEAAPFLVLDFESYPISHAAALVLLWAAVFAAAHLARTRYARGAAVAGAATTIASPPTGGAGFKSVRNLLAAALLAVAVRSAT